MSQHSVHKESAIAGDARSVLLAETDPFALAGLSFLCQSAGIEAVGTTSRPEGIEDLCRRFPDSVLVIAGLRPEMSTLAVVSALRERAIGNEIVAVMDDYSGDEIPRLIDLGVKGLVARDEGPAKLFEAIRSVDQDQRIWISPGIARKLVGRGNNDLDQPRLTVRERDILWLAAHGHSNDRIAEPLDISAGTVRNHLSTIYSKLTVHTRAEAVAWAWMTGLALQRPPRQNPTTF